MWYSPIVNMEHFDLDIVEKTKTLALSRSVVISPARKAVMAWRANGAEGILDVSLRDLIDRAQDGA